MAANFAKLPELVRREGIAPLQTNDVRQPLEGLSCPSRLATFTDVTDRRRPDRARGAAPNRVSKKKLAANLGGARRA
jgi:hypothetical protein